jgi:hypothetical protein
MSFDIDVASVQQYTTNVQLLLQQKGSVLRDVVSIGNYTGKAAKAIEQIGAVTASRVTTRHDDTQLKSTDHSARWVFPRDYIWADLIDDEDKLRLLIDPTSSYAMNGAYAIGRAMDDEIIEAFFAKSKIGENGNEDIAFPDKQCVKDKSTPTGMSVDKLRDAKKLLRMAEVDMDHDPIYCAITAQQEQDLLKETQVTSLDFNTKPVLVDGKLTSFMGIQFIPIQRLPLVGTLRACPVWAKSGMHLGIWNDINVSVDRRPDKRNSMQVMAKGTFGATRTQEAKIVNILCKE